MAESLIVKTIPILRMDCPTCIPMFEKQVLKVEGVQKVRGNYMAKSSRSHSILLRPSLPRSRPP